ncbi:hypothetical protein ACP275_14G278100 [Erythranthe tilingii]
MGSMEMGFEETTLTNQSTMEMKLKLQMKKKKTKTKSRNFLISRLGCFRFDGGVSTAETPDPDGGFSVEAGPGGRRDHSPPTHLVVMVNGIIGSAQNWRYVAKQFVKAYPNDVIVHCSESNSSMLTFDGVDVMGKRLADEVICVVDSHPNLRKISFVGHSLGGLIARYAIALLYNKQDLIIKNGDENGECGKIEAQISSLEDKLRRNIAGLEPVNFITSATPHLGCRGHKQVPVFCGFYAMEKLASRASWLLGKTGRHLFLSDCDDGKPPLLLRMSTDYEDLKFISALKLFKRRVAYANTRFDHLVGWSSSSLRRRKELPNHRNFQKNAKYPHVVNEEKPNAQNSHEEFSLEAKVAKGKISEMEETMIRGLTRMSWERVDVSFSGSIQRLLAHNTIQVKTRCINYDGADVIQHTVDNFQL